MRKLGFILIGAAVLSLTLPIQSAQASSSTAHSLAKKKLVGPFTLVMQPQIVIQDDNLLGNQTPSTPAQIQSIMNSECQKLTFSNIQMSVNSAGRPLATVGMQPVLPVTQIVRDQGTVSAQNFAAGFGYYKGTCQYSASFPRIPRIDSSLYDFSLKMSGVSVPLGTPLPSSRLTGVQYFNAFPYWACFVRSGVTFACGKA